MSPSRSLSLNTQCCKDTYTFVMNENNGKKLNMLDLVMMFFLKYDLILKIFTPLKDQIAVADLKVKNIHATLNQKGYSSKGKTINKETVRQTLIRIISPMAQRAKGWALITGNSEMLAIFDLTESDFKVKDNSFVILINTLLASMTSNLTELLSYNITTVEVTLATNALLDFVNVKDAPKQQIEIGKTVSVDIIKEIKSAIATVEICDTLLIGQFQNSNPEMVAEYINDRKVMKSVKSHTTIIAHIYEDEAHLHPIADAEISIPELKRSELTNLQGEGEIIQFVHGQYKLHVAANGFNYQDIPFSIATGKHVEIDVVMQPSIIYGHSANKLGLPNVGNNVRIPNTSFSTVTDIQGNYKLFQVPDGKNILQISNESGDSDTIEFTKENGQDLKIDFIL